jgi:AcrR family transcriptional regulator
MKRNTELSREYLHKIRNELKSFRITLDKVAEEVGVTRRAVEYFFEGKTASNNIHNACKRLIARAATKELEDAMKKQKRALSIL